MVKEWSSVLSGVNTVSRAKKKSSFFEAIYINEQQWLKHPFF